MKKALILLVLFVLTQIVSAQNKAAVLTLPSKVFKENRTIKVSLPKEYPNFPNRAYAVVYLFDAQSDVFFNFFNSTIDYLTSNGYIAPVILVGVSSANRQYEFTPEPETENGRKNYRKSGGAALLSRYLKEELQPMIQSQYRCLPYQIGIGHSLGGTYLTNCLISSPELFNAYIVVSPNYHYDDEQLVRRFQGLNNTNGLKGKFLYIAYGKGDFNEEKFRPATQKMDSVLSSKNITGLKWLIKSLDNDDHGTTPMEGVFKGLVALNRQLMLPYDLFKSYQKDTSRPFIEKIKNYYKQQSDWAGIQLPLLHETNIIGYNCFYANKLKDAIDVFKWAISLYPDDINLFDSMGEMQQSSGNIESARSYYKKALELLEVQKAKLPESTYASLRKSLEGRITSLNKPANPH